MALSSRTDHDEKTRNGEVDNDEDTDVRVVSQAQVDRVAQVSRTSTGQAHQHPGYELIGLDDDASEEQQAAAENRPVKRSKGGKGDKTPGESTSGSSGSRGSSAGSGKVGESTKA